MPEVKAELKAAYQLTKSAPNANMLALQRSILTKIGIEPDFGVKSLQEFIATHPEDKEVQLKVAQYTMCAQVAIQEASMTEEQRIAFYRNIPEFMHHFPHIHMMQQNSAGTSSSNFTTFSYNNLTFLYFYFAFYGNFLLARSSVQSSQPGVPTANSSSLSPSMDANRASMEAFLATSDGKAKLNALTTRMSSVKARVEKDVAPLSSAERRTFFDEFREDPVFSKMGGGKIDSAERIESFLKMDDESLYRLMKMQYVLLADMQQGKGELNKLMMATLQRKKELEEQQLKTLEGHGHDHQHSSECGHNSSGDHGASSTVSGSKPMQR